MERFNAEMMRIATGKAIRVEVSHGRSGSSMNDILKGDMKPIAWSPGDHPGQL